MIEEMFLILAIFGITVIFYKINIPVLVLVTAIFGLLININSLTAVIPFTPLLQIMLSVIELTLLIFSIERVRGK
jgi:hypothetical protein